jgi:acyl-coenzyme A thioesterase PaaI-like protein
LSFRDATALEPIGPGRYRATIAAGWDIAGNANGGYLLSILARAVTEATGQPDPLTITGHYLAPGRPGPATVEVVTHRIGGRHATAGATLSVDVRPLLVALATATDLATASGPEHAETTPPPVPEPDDCVPIEPTDTFPPPFMGRVELRIHPEDAGFARGTKSGQARMRGWFRLRDGEAVDTLALIVATDAFPPTIFNADLPVAWTPTVELTAHVRAAPGAGWLRCAFATRFITGGYLEADGEIWDGDHLIAQSRQLALVPRG